MILEDGSNLSIVIQGHIADQSQIQFIVNSYRKHLPKSEIIISTWESVSISLPVVDLVILNKDPGSINLEKAGGRAEHNLNRQIVSSKHGVFAATRKYCLKIRSDLAIDNCNFINIFNKFLSTFRASIKDCGFFLINNTSSKDPYFLYPAPLHFCDWFILSEKRNMAKLFDVKELKVSDMLFQNSNDIPGQYKKTNTAYVRFSVETYLWSSYLHRFATFKLDNEFDFNSKVQFIHDNFISSHCIISDNKKLGIVTLKKEYKGVTGFKLRYEYSYFDWLLCSKQYRYTSDSYLKLIIITVIGKCLKYAYSIYVNTKRRVQISYIKKS